MKSTLDHRTERENTPEPTPHIRVLIAEDREFYREMLKMVIEVLPGVQVLDAVGNGCQALRSVAAQHPDLALLDLHLSGLNGLQCLALIHEYHPATRVFIIAAEDSDDLRATCLAQGADGFVCKRRLHPELRHRMAETFFDWAAGSVQEHLGWGSVCGTSIA